MARRTKPDTLSLLKADHRAVEQLFERFEESETDEERERIAQEICLELSIHATVEEELIYPACRGVVDDHLVDEAYVEHDGAKALIAELLSAADDRFRDAKVKVLHEMIKHHVKEEEKREGLFGRVKSSELDLEALGERIAARKEELKEDFLRHTIPLPTTCSLSGEPPLRGSVRAA